MTLAVIAVYLGLVILVGSLSHRLFRGTGEDYFVASRSIGPFLLLMSLFGTNMTAFAILGASGEAYHAGIGVFSLMASSSALVIPCVFFFVGTRVWALGKRHGFLTQAEFFRQRWQSDGLGLLLFAVLVALLVPYLLIGIMAGGLTLQQITGGQVPEWAGGLLVCAVVMTYVCYGGLRGTAWANAFQTLVFTILGGVAFYVIISRLGGLQAVMTAVGEAHPDLLVRGDHIKPLKLLTYTCIPLSVGMFPHMFMHWLTARSARTFRTPLVLYPLCIAAVWVPSVVLGVSGRLDFPALKGPAANSILVRLIDLHAPEVMAGLLAAGVFAAVMSSLDSQSLSVGTMFTQDIVRHYGSRDGMSERRQVLYGRLFVVLVLIVAYVLAQGLEPLDLPARGLVLHRLRLPLPGGGGRRVLAAQHPPRRLRLHRQRRRPLDLVLQPRLGEPGLHPGRRRHARGRHPRRLGGRHGPRVAGHAAAGPLRGRPLLPPD